MDDTKQEKPYYENFAYLFVPFTTQKLEDFPAFFRSLGQRKGWNSVKTENKYLHRYVAERVTGSRQETADGEDKKETGHFRLDAEFAREKGVLLGDVFYGIRPKKFRNNEKEQFPFTIANVELFAFNTAVGILAFELRFADNDPVKIAAAQFNLRKITTQKILPLEQTSQPMSFVYLARKLLQDNGQLDFFFYAARNNEKANFLTYIDVPAKKAGYDEELFRLKWCYNENFPYDEAETQEDNENYTATKNILWGLSVSAAVCLVNRTEEQKYFLENVFQDNFRNQYLMTYVLLLHQKYMMYLFLTKMSVGLEGNLKQLEQYKTMLYEFENNYMFSYISEVPQYQRFYTKVRKVFALEELFHDVQEPLTQLTDIQRQTAEKEERERDGRVNVTLSILSLLTIVSALTDAVGFPANVSWMFSETGAKVAQIILLVGVGIFSVAALIRLFKQWRR